MESDRLFLLQLLLLLFLRCKDCKADHGHSPDKHIYRHTRAAEGDCFRNLTVKGNGGTLTSPNFPNNYPSSIDCRWLLTAAEPNATILLKIDSLDIEPDTDCKLDYLQVYLGATALAPALGPFCGTVNNKLLKTNSSKLLLVFHSDPVYENKGFSLDYFTQTTSDCQDLLTEESGSLRSPGFPGDYPDNTDCWTLIRVNKGRKIILFIDSVDMEEGENCTFDYVQILDGETRNSSLLAQLCQHSDVKSFESSSNALLVHFHSDDSLNKKGYRARYSSVDTRSSPIGDCQWVTAEDNGTIASPNYPSNYHSHSNCTVWILAPKGSRIFFTFDALQLEMDPPDCSFDFLLLEEAPHSNSSEPTVLGRFCGNDGEPKNLTSSQNEVRVRFQSDDFMEFSGFKLRYWILGNGKVQKEKVVRDDQATKFSFSVVPQNATLDLGMFHMLHCSTQNPAATIRWLKEDTFLAGGNPLPGLKVLVNNTLWIQSMEPALSGIYSCVAVSPDGTATITAKAYILVKNSTRGDESCDIVFLKTPKDSSFVEGSSAHLECSVAGTDVQTSWERNGQPLKTQGHITVLKNGYVYMDRVKLRDAGVYTCVARDTALGCQKKVSLLLQVRMRIKIEDICGSPKVGKPSQEIPQMDHGKIVGGHNAKKGAYPWQVMLWEPNLKSFCGGTILNERWIATAAHCFINYNNLRWDRIVIKFGKFDRQHEEEQEFRTGIADSTSIVVHPAYNRFNFDHDLALVRLREHLQFTDYILPVCLGDRNATEHMLGGLPDNKLRMGTVIGWGKLKDDGPTPRFLQEIRLPIVDQSDCVKSTEHKVTRNMFCAGYAQEILGDACHGDSGGPFLMSHQGKWYLVGVVSWGEGCGAANKYGFYTRIPNYISWIQGIIKS